MCGSGVRACPATIALRVGREEGEKKKKIPLPSPHRYLCCCKTVRKKRRGNALAAEELRRRLEGKEEQPATPGEPPLPGSDGGSRTRRRARAAERGGRDGERREGGTGGQPAPKGSATASPEPPAAAPARSAPAAAGAGLGEVWPCVRMRIYSFALLFPWLRARRAALHKARSGGEPCVCRSWCECGVCACACAVCAVCASGVSCSLAGYNVKKPPLVAPSAPTLWVFLSLVQIKRHVRT